jgi:hypothetical protein
MGERLLGVSAEQVRVASASFAMPPELCRSFSMARRGA